MAVLLGAAAALLLASACGPAGDEPPARGRSSVGPEPSIVGTWTRRSHMDGRRELFVGIGPETMTFDSELDTIFTFAYVRRGNELQLTPLWDTASYVARISRLEPDSLVLEGVRLPAVTGALRLWRGTPRRR